MTSDTTKNIELKNIIPQLLAVAFVALVVFYPSSKNQLKPAAILAVTSQAVNSATEPGPVQDDFLAKVLEEEKINPDEKYEKTFDMPVDIVWNGKIYGFMMSGDALAIVKIPEDKKYPAFFAWSAREKDIDIEGKVKIIGQWTGITCAYRFTVFGGRCVPEVVIKTIERVNE